MAVIENYTEKEKFNSEKRCKFCNSQEGKARLVGNYIVELSEVNIDGETKLACQGCRIKQRSFLEAEKSQQKKRSLLKKLISFGLD